jgi:hypothetical protein
MASLLLAIVTAWCLFESLRGGAGLSEMAVFVIVISFFVIYFPFDWGTVFLRPFVLLALFVLIVLMIRILFRGDEGRLFGLAGLAGAGLLFYFGILSNYVQVWRGPVLNLDTPVWNGTFFVANGGNTLLVNGHRMSSAATAQRYAVDIVKLSQAGRSATTLLPGEDLSQYLIYGEHVYAPCAGTVLLVDTRFDDLPAGISDPENPAGNYVAIGCDQGMTVVLAHLQRDIRPGLGERVEAGQYIGKIGNSGNTSEPHLHIHAVAGLVGDEKQALFTGNGIPFTLNHTVLVRNSTLTVIGCPPVPGIDILSGSPP